MNETRKIAAILVSDVVGFSRLVGADEDRILARLRALRSDMMDPTIAVHHGRVVKRTGDGAIVEFRSVIDAVRCALEVQSGMVERNAGLPPERRIEFRVGIHLGDVVEESDGDLMGDGVNIASRLVCEAGGVCISEDAYRQIRDKIKEQFVDLGEQVLKNIARPMRAYQVKPDPGETKPEPAAAEAHSVGPALPDKPSVAVLPFQNISGDPEQEYFADGIVEDIITALSRFRSFAVIARNSSFVYKGRAVDVRQAAQELGVRYVLEGSVRKSGERLRITAQLVDGTTSAHLWADRFDGTVEDVFDVQDRITESVATIVEPQIREAEIERSRRERPGSVAAYDLYLQALPKFRAGTQDEHAAAYALLSRAIGLEPNNGTLLAWTMDVLQYRLAAGWPELTGDDKAVWRDLAHRALANARGDAAVLARCGYGLIGMSREYDLGLATLRGAIEINPNNVDVLRFAGAGNIHCGSLDDALAYFNRALRLSPGDPHAFHSLTGIAHVKMILGQYAEALAFAERTLVLNTDHDFSHWMVIAANAQLGRLDEARRWLAKFKALVPGITIARISAGQADKDGTRMAAILEGLRLAGLEEA